MAPRSDETIDTYLRSLDLKPGTLKEKQRLLTKHFLSKHSATPLSDLTTRHITNILDELRPTPSEALHVYRALKAFFNWAVQRDLIDQSPIGKLQPPSKDKARERILTDDELKAIWAALGKADPRYAGIVKMLMLTGQRLSQFAKLRKAWVRSINPKAIIFPPEIMKSGKQHELYLGRTARHTLWLYLIEADDYVFGNFTSFGKNKEKLDKDSGVTGWTIHDLRRTYASTAARLGISQPIIERLLAHSTPGGNSLHLVYNRHKYTEEMQKAVSTIDDFYENLLHVLPRFPT